MENPTIRDWDMAKRIILMKWDRIDAVGLERTHGNIDQIIDLISEKYDDPRETIIQDLRNLAGQMKMDF